MVGLQPGRVQRKKEQLIVVLLGYTFISLSWSVHLPRLAFSPCVCQGGVSAAWCDMCRWKSCLGLLGGVRKPGIGEQ